MWKIIDEKTYSSKARSGLRVFEGYTDVEGNCPMGNGRPYILTVWGDRETDLPVLKIIMTKENPDQPQWDYQYFEYLAPVKNAISEPENV